MDRHVPGVDPGLDERGSLHRGVEPLRLVGETVQRQERMHRERPGLLVEHVGVVAGAADVVERRHHPARRELAGLDRGGAVPRVARRGGELGRNIWERQLRRHVFVAEKHT